MIPHLRPGGVYLCEDVTGEFNPFQAYICGLTRNLDAYILNKEHTGIQTNTFQRFINSVHLYPYVVIIEKSETTINNLAAEKHGTQWQPFL
jgi:hypothetical protein